ncbi:MAG: hypothetical protein CBC82_07545 [Cellvibrionales bacterium TMED122]|nr:MAG: hypothetical protein CBC82_07545 [Cellvibrionales bacterium TMED122]
MLNFKKGFCVVETKNISKLNNLRSKIYAEIKKIYNLKEKDIEKGLNNFHSYFKKQTPILLNSKRIQLIKKINENIDITGKVFEIFEDSILELIGPDIMGQKNANLVIQIPADQNPSEIHRDAPANSPYEIVVWVPLVDCYGTKNMFLMDYENTSHNLKHLKQNNDWELFEKNVRKNAIKIHVKFGQALIFMTGLLHGSEINSERTTRFSLNTRYKNIFAPSGLKNQLQFFKKIRETNLVKYGSLIEIEELLK